jgi:hypothetical protein
VGRRGWGFAAGGAEAKTGAQLQIAGLGPSLAADSRLVGPSVCAEEEARHAPVSSLAPAPASQPASAPGVGKKLHSPMHAAGAWTVPSSSLPTPTSASARATAAAAPVAPPPAARQGDAGLRRLSPRAGLLRGCVEQWALTCAPAACSAATHGADAGAGWSRESSAGMPQPTGAPCVRRAVRSRSEGSELLQLKGMVRPAQP